MVNSGNTGGPYFGGATLSYVCSTGFDSADNPITCVCDTTGDVPAVWNCSGVNFANTCQTGKNTVAAKYVVISK